jgi:hypothetical protein
VGSIKNEGTSSFGFALVLATARRALLVESRKLGLPEYAEDLGPRRGTATTGPMPLPWPPEVRLWCSSDDNFCAFGFSQMVVRRQSFRNYPWVAHGGPGPAATGKTLS